MCIGRLAGTNLLYCINFLNISIDLLIFLDMKYVLRYSDEFIQGQFRHF